MLSCNLAHDFFQNVEAGNSAYAASIEREDPKRLLSHVVVTTDQFQYLYD